MDKSRVLASILRPLAPDIQFFAKAITESSRVVANDNEASKGHHRFGKHLTVFESTLAEHLVARP